MTRPRHRPRHRRAGRLAGAARHRRQRGAAGDHRSFPAGAGRRAVARHLLRAGLRLADAGVRQAGRPARPSPDLPHRHADLRRRLRGLRRRPRLAALPVGARRPGHRHGAGDLLHARAGHVAVSGERAHARPGGPGHGDVARRGGRSIPRRHPGRAVGLARGLLGARADRARHACAFGPAAVAQARPAALRCRGRGAAGRVHERAVAVAGAVATRRGARPASPRPVRRLAGRSLRLRAARATRAGADHPSGPVRRSRLRRSQRHGRAGERGGLLDPAAHAVLPGECAETFGAGQRCGVGAVLRRQPRGRTVVGLAGRADRPAADRLRGHRRDRTGPPAACLHRGRHARAPGGVAADCPRGGPRPAQRGLHRHRDGDALRARPRRRRQPRPAHAHLRHRQRRLGADGAACRGRGRPFGDRRLPGRLPLRLSRGGRWPAGGAAAVARRSAGVVEEATS